MHCLRALASILLLVAVARADYFDYQPTQEYGVDTYGIDAYGDDTYGSEYGATDYGVGDDYGADFGVDAYGVGDDYGVEYAAPSGYGDDYGVTEVEVGYGAPEFDSYGPVSYGKTEAAGYGPVEDSYGSWDNEYDGYAPVVKSSYAPRKSFKQVKFDDGYGDLDFYGKEVAPRKSFKQVKFDDGYGDLDFYGKEVAPRKSFKEVKFDDGYDDLDFYGKEVAPRKSFKQVKFDDGYGDLDFYGEDFGYGKQVPAKKAVVLRKTVARKPKAMRPMPIKVHDSGYDDYGYDVKKDSVHDSTEYGQSDMQGKSLYGRKYVEDGGMYEVGKIKGFGGENQDDLYEHVSKYRTGGKIDSYGEKKHKYGAFDAYGHAKKSGHNFLRRKIDIGGKMFAKGSLGAFGKAGAKGKMGMQQKFKSVVRKHKRSGPKKQQFQGYY